MKKPVDPRATVVVEEIVVVLLFPEKYRIILC
jgi:hypothetical protein